MDNSYQDNFAEFSPVPRDVWLAVDSLNNNVTERLGTLVLDQGTSNSVVLHADDGIDYCN